MVVTRDLYRRYTDFIVLKQTKNEIDFFDNYDRDGDKIKAVYDIFNYPLKVPDPYKMTPASFSAFNRQLKTKLRIR